MFPPIIMLHYVSDEKKYDLLKPYSISKESFIQLLDYLEKNSFETLLFPDLEKRSYSSKTVVLTFDDCDKALFEFAIPELVKRKMKAVFYMPTAHLGGYNSWDADRGMSRITIMDSSDIKTLSGLGMEIGSHAHNHQNLNLLSETEVRFELSESKKVLESIIEKPVVSVAYPFGGVPRKFQSILKDLGYRFGLSIFYPTYNRYALRRFIYHDGDSLKSIRQKLSWKYTIYRYLTDPLKRG